MNLEFLYQCIVSMPLISESIMNVHFLCALCDFARVLSRICLLRGIFIARPPRSQRYIYPCETFTPSAHPIYVLCLAMQGCKNKKKTKVLT